MSQSHIQIVTNILNDLQHPNVTIELINEILNEIDINLPEIELYEFIIHFCPELR